MSYKAKLWCKVYVWDVSKVTSVRYIKSHLLNKVAVLRYKGQTARHKVVVEF